MDRPYSDRLSDGRTSPNNSSPLSFVGGGKASLHAGLDFDVAEDRLGANPAASLGAVLGRETIRSFGTAGFDVADTEDLLDASLADPSFGAPLGTEVGTTVGCFAFAAGLVDDRFFDFLSAGLDVFLATAEEDVDIFTCSFSLFPALLDDFDAW